MTAARQRAKTGVPGLDDVLVGGLPRGRIYLLKGTAGAGKTTLAMQYLLNGARAGEKGLYVALSESRDELEEVAQSHRWDLSGIELLEIADSAEPRAQDDNTLFLPAEVELGETTRRILEAVVRAHPSRVVIDSLSEIRYLAGTEIRYRKQIMALKQLFMAKNSTAILVDDEVSGSGMSLIESIAHGVLLLQQIVPRYGPERRQLVVSKLRGVKYRGGFHDLRINTGGLVVFPRLIPEEHIKPFQPQMLESGLPELDRMLGGGLDRGTTTLVIGPAGTGKSAVAAQYATAAALRGESSLFLIFEESRETLFARTSALGIPMAEQVDAGRIRLRAMNPVEITPGEFTQIVRDAVEQQGTQLVVIDSLNGYFNAMPEENLLELQLHELFRYLRQLGVSVILTLAQHGIVGPLAGGPIDLSYLADTLVLLRYFEAGGQIRKSISVPKKRAGRHESTIREMAMDRRGLHVGAPLTAFRGVLTGLPEYTGAPANDLIPEGEPRPGDR
jgi:circadian clock protein KaiC